MTCFISDKIFTFHKLSLLLFISALICVGFSAKAQASYMESYLQKTRAEHYKVPHYKEHIYQGVKSFYAAHDYQPIWTKNGQGLNELGKAALAELAKSWQHGLRPDKYVHPDADNALHSKRRSVLARSEFLLSYGLALYAHDMSAMRVDPSAIKQKSKYWREPIKAENALNAIVRGKYKNAPLSAEDLRANIQAIAPTSYLYKRLKDEYVALVNSVEWNKKQDKIVLTGLVREGQSHKSVAAVRARFNMPKRPHWDDYIYDETLAARVLKFQKDNGLKTDGVLGPQTVKYMNRTVHDRADQLIANMERMRWLEPNRPNRYIEVNIPSMSLWAFENGKAALSMPVVVGRPARQTKSFKTEVTGVRINPRWNVPYRIRTQDFWPDMKADPKVLIDKKIDVIEGFGREAVYHDPTAINWSDMSYREFNKYRLVQKPGDHNALGRIRMLMPNPYSIFMHDTNHPEVFEKDYRAASSGCIRLKYPEKLAEFVLKGHDVEWGTEQMEGIYNSLKTKDLKVQNTMPVYVLYQTNWLNGRGDIVFGPDLYKRDKRLVAALKASREYVPPRPELVAPASQDMKMAALAQ